MIPVRILGTASLLPGPAVPTREVARRALPGKDPAVTEQKTGIKTRHWAPPDSLIADLAAAAVREACAAGGLPLEELRRIILVTSSGGDVIGPATANAVIHALGIDNRCDGFDLANACMGFMTGFDLGARCVATGLGPVAVVAAELMSRYIRPEDPRPYVVFGDAAAAAVLGPGRPGEGILGSFARNDGSLGGTAYITHPKVAKVEAFARFDIPSREMGRIVTDALKASTDAVLSARGETIADVDWVLPHQPNGSMLQTIVEVLGVDPARVVPVVSEVGSVVSASIPTSLDRLMRTRSVKPGDRILMIGVGSGLAYGAILYRVAPLAL
jgi:3-oxoacyl-(acyl-carrier-protein) synthase III